MLSTWTTAKFCRLVKSSILQTFFSLSNSRFVWAKIRAAGNRRTIPVRSIGGLPLLEALPSLPLDIWKSRQSSQNKMGKAANET